MLGTADEATLDRQQVVEERPRVGPADAWPTVFIVDDDEFLRALIGDWVEAAGFRPVRLPGGEACVAALSLYKPVAVVLDRHMAGMNGADTETVDAIRIANPKIPVIALTGETDAALALDLIERGASEFLSKPVHQTQLIKALLVAAGQEASRKP
jgi:FixJ family two-component response regulator